LLALSTDLQLAKLIIKTLASVIILNLFIYVFMVLKF
jgi:hypothetical protein